VINIIKRKASTVSAKQFNIVFSSNEKNFIEEHCVNVTREKSRIRNLGKFVACIVLDITEDKKCKICNSSITYRDFKTYVKQEYCSTNCREKDRAVINKAANKSLRGNKKAIRAREQTMLKRLGVTNAMKSSKILEERKASCIKKYGVEHTSQVEEYKKKRAKTCKEIYGYDNIIETYRESNINKKLKGKYESLLSLKNIKPLFTLNEYKGILENGNTLCYDFECRECKCVLNKHLGSWVDFDFCDHCENKTNRYEDSIEYIKNDRKILNGKEIDFLIPSKNIGIEVNGLYYHSSKFLKDKNYHLKKTNSCKSAGIHLIHVFGDELLNKAALMSRLYGCLGCNKIKIGARKCEVRVVDKKAKKKFIQKYHLQGDVRASSINIGLYYKKRLVSIMTFGHKRKSLGSTHTEGSYELYRFCTMRNVSVLGGAKKMMKYFIKNFSPSEIISYADLRYTREDNNIYSSLGMDLVRRAGVNYWVVKGNKRFHRFGFRKSLLSKKINNFDPLKTEKQNLSDNNIHYIYDCGNLLYKITVK